MPILCQYKGTKSLFVAKTKEESSANGNILIAHEIFHSFRANKSKEGWAAIKLDMEKAYDQVNWDFIINILKKFGFNDKFVGWIKDCITTVSFSVLVNNGPTDQFFPEKGLRQGDPLSPYLFILGAEILTQMLQDDCNNYDNHIGFSVCRQVLSIPFLSFIDDMIIFAKANMASCQRTKANSRNVLLYIRTKNQLP